MAKKNTSLLWSLDGTHHDQTSYLFGTMHVKDYRAFSWLPEIQRYILRCDVYAAESEIDTQSQTGSAYFFLPQGITLQSLLGDHAYQRLKLIIQKSFQIDLETYKNYLPILISNIIAERVLANSYSTSLDAELWNFAKQNNMEVLGVESADKQIEILQNIPIPYQVKSLKAIGRNVTKYRSQILALISAYEKQNTTYLYKATKNSLGKMRKYMLYERNDNMANTIYHLINNSKAFVGVGASHMFGNKGILTLLKRQGISVSPIPLT